MWGWWWLVLTACRYLIISLFCLYFWEMFFQVELSVQFSCSVVSDSLRPHGLQHARLPCPSPSPGACSNSCPLSWWCHPTISSSAAPFYSCSQSFPASGRVFSRELAVRIWWPKYWSFSFNISPSNEYSGLVSFRMDWLGLLAVQGTLKTVSQARQPHSHGKGTRWSRKPWWRGHCNSRW